MATQGTPLIAPFTLEDLPRIEHMPMGDLCVPFVMGANSLISSVIPSRFPVPPAAGGFLIDIDEEFVPMALSSPYFIVGAVYPESDYLEPTTGQIWPR